MFKFKGISSKDMKVVVEEEHFIAKAPQRIETIEIEGRDGTIFNKLGYGAIEQSIKVQILDQNKIDDIFSWLNCEGTLEYDNRVTNARFYSSVEPKRKATIKVADFNFIRDPFWYKLNDEFVTVTDKVVNEGTIYSRPIIKLERGIENSIDLQIGDVRFKYNFGDDTYVEIDCEEMTATYEGMLRNRQLEIDYNFPVLETGDNNINVYSGDATIKFKRKDRWL